MTSEEYIKAYTKTCSNENVYGSHEPWLTPEHARNVAQITKEETANKVVDWLYEQLNFGKLECGNIENLIKNLKETIAK